MARRLPEAVARQVRQNGRNWIGERVPLLGGDEEFEPISEQGGATRPLATFRLANGNEVQMFSRSDSSELTMGEIAGPSSGETFAIEPSTRPAELFQLLAPPEVPVPRALLSVDRTGVLRGRGAVDRIDALIQVPSERFATSTHAAGAGSCQSGSAGATFFHQHHCNTSGGPGYGKSEQYCYDDAAGWIQKTSRRRRRAVYTRMAACGTGMARVRHLVRPTPTSGFKVNLTVNVQAPTISRWWSTGSWRFRRVRFDALDDDVFVRGWIRFHTQAADWWSL